MKSNFFNNDLKKKIINVYFDSMGFLCSAYFSFSQVCNALKCSKKENRHNKEWTIEFFWKYYNIKRHEKNIQTDVIKLL